jgi:hypothetical protein
LIVQGFWQQPSTVRPSLHHTIPGHATVDSKVEGIEEANYNIDDECNIAGKIIVQSDMRIDGGTGGTPPEPRA